jgi:7-keto-8-aminopelargonate synthetase-like enzyme
MDVVRDEPERRRRLWNNQRYFLERLDSAGIAPLSRCTPIVPVSIGDERLCDQVAAGLRDSGYHVDAIVYPAIAPGSALLRFIMNANHTPRQIGGVVEALGRLLS